MTSECVLRTTPDIGEYSTKFECCNLKKAARNVDGIVDGNYTVDRSRINLRFDCRRRIARVSEPVQAHRQVDTTLLCMSTMVELWRSHRRSILLLSKSSSLEIHVFQIEVGPGRDPSSP